MTAFSSEPIIQLENTDIYQNGNKLILADVNFEINKGDFVFLIGRTGSGKSSLLKTLYADLCVGVGKRNSGGLSSGKTETGRMCRSCVANWELFFQDFQLFFDRTVEENLEFVLRATGWTDKALIKNRISEVLMQVGLGTLQKKMPHQLSGGEQQRVVIARAMLNEPQILLADEPTGNLDPEVGEQIMQVFQSINTAGTAILMATHNYDFLKKYPARVLKCEAGSVSEM